MKRRAEMEMDTCIDGLIGGWQETDDPDDFLIRMTLKVHGG